MPLTDVSPGAEISSWCLMKWARGVAHLNELQSRVLLWNTGTHTSAELSLDSTAKVITSILRVESPPPLRELSLILGDAVHCMRSALDALVWELAHLDGGEPEDPTRVMLPICYRGSDWRSARKDLATVPPAFLERIRAMQPYADPKPSETYLAVLGSMSNRDKHRGMIEASATANSINWAFTIDTTDLGDKTPEGAMDGVSIEEIGTRQIADGMPFLKMTTSTRVRLNRDSSPVAIAFTVDIGGKQYTLDSVVEVLAKTNFAIAGICGAPAPAA